MQTAIYVRVSTDEQAQEGFSIRAQEQKLKDYAKIKEWPIHNIYTDEGISGKNITERPAVTKMIEDIKSGYVKNVVVFKIDRLTRSTTDLAYLIELFNQNNCAFNSLMESIDTHTASGRMFIKIIGIFAEFERENIAERVKTGIERKVREGYTIASHNTSYGYDKAKGQKIQTINEEEANIVREIFDMYVNQNIKIKRIAKMLNFRKVTSKKNSIWSDISIKQTLTNSNYIGKVRYALRDKERNFEADGLHEPIVELELFEKAQKMLEKNRKITKTKLPRAENYYLGFLYCPKCGTRLTTYSVSSKLKDGQQSYYASYRCRNRILNNCGFGDVNSKKLEQAFQEYMKNAADFEHFSEIATENKEQDRKNAEKLLQNYNKQLQRLKDKESEIMTVYIDGNIDFKEYRDMKNRIDGDKLELVAEIKTVAETLTLTADKTYVVDEEDIVLKFNVNWTHLTDIEKRQFLLEFVKRIDISAKKAKNNFNWIVKVENVEFAQLYK